MLTPRPPDGTLFAFPSQPLGPEAVSHEAPAWEPGPFRSSPRATLCPSMTDDPNYDEYNCQEHGPSDMDYCPKCAEEGEEDKTCAKNPGSASGHSWVWDPPLPNSPELDGAPLAGTYGN